MTYLVLRFSSLSHVAMTVPVLASVSHAHPEDEFIVVAKKRLGAMFYGLPNVRFHEADVHDLQSLIRLYRDLLAYSIDAVIDLQDVARTHILSLLFRLRGKPIYRIHAGRWSKRWMRLRGAQRCRQLPSQFERYRDTFRRAGLDSRPEDFSALPVNRQAQLAVNQRFGTKQGKWIGIAPFAKYKSNMLPYRTTKLIIQRLSTKADTRIFLFGAGRIECEMLRQWASVFPHVEAVAGILPLEQELELMRQLDLMICMDSANQHLSSLVGLRAISVWCATHTKLGFMGWKQHPEDIVSLHRLRCRPCTCHGTNRCRYRNFACRNINAEQIIQRIYE